MPTPSREHQEALHRYMSEYEAEGYKVVQIEGRGQPDAILFKDGKALALLIDTKSLSVIRSQTESLRKRGQVIRDYSEYDGIVQVCPSYSGHSAEAYLRCLEMLLEGKTLYRIAKTLGISHAVIFDWVHNEMKPREILDLEQLDENTELIYDGKLTRRTG